MEHNRANTSFSAADIQRYLEGKMPPAEMHALEKAALDDPFLNEAIEGYAGMDNKDWQPQLTELRQSLAAPGGTAKLVPMGRKRFAWLKYAAAVLILGGGIATFYMVNRPSGGSDASTVAKADNTAPANGPTANNPMADSAVALANNEVAAQPVPGKPATVSAEGNPTSGAVTTFSTTTASADSLGFAVAEPTAKDRQDKMLPKTPAAEKEAANESYSVLAPVAAKPAAAPAMGNMADAERKKSVSVPSRTESREMTARSQGSFFNQQTLNNTQGRLRADSARQVDRSFVAQVVDANNNPLPFANINVRNEGFGTYADARGQVRLVSTDSIIPIEVNSLGFESQTILLRSSNQPTTIRLREEAGIAYQEKATDRKQASSNIMSRRAFLQRDAQQNAEPADGWDKYDTYISNNLVIPDDLVKRNIHGEVAISFDVEKNGSISNIKVDKSLCNDCDEIAKRIVAQGPQWKVKKGKKGKGKVTVQF
jgi:hypothetical protein